MKNPKMVAIKLLPSVEGKEEIKGEYFKVVEANSENGQYYLYIGRVNSCRAGGWVGFCRM